MTIPPADRSDVIATPPPAVSPPDNGNMAGAIEDLGSDAMIVAELGRRALTEPDTAAVLTEIVRVVAERLGMEYVKILELVPGREGFLLTAGFGWKPGYVGQVVVPLIPESQAGYTMIHDMPIVVEDLRNEKRFKGMPLLHEHGIVSGMSIVLKGRHGPHGIMSAHTTRKRKIRPDELGFLESVGVIVAAALDRRQTEIDLADARGRLHLAMDAGRMGTWEWNITTNEVTWSETLEEIHGIPAGSFGGSFEAYAYDIHADDRDYVATTIQHSLETGSHALEYRIVRPSGEIRWLAARGLLIRDATGQPVRMMGICSDITDQKTAEQVLRQAEEKYRTLFENAAFGVFQTTPDGRFITANESLARILGFGSAEEMQSIVQDIGHQVHVDASRREEFARLLQEQDVVTGFESLARRHDSGAEVWISLTARARRDTAGNITHFEGIVEDVTARKAAARRLAAQYAVTRLLAEAPGVTDAMPRIICAISEELGWTLGAIWVVDRESELLRCLDVAAVEGASTAAFDEISRSLSFRRGVGLPGRVWATSEPVWVDDVREDPNFPRADAARRAGLCSAFAFPIELEGETIGVMEFFSPESRTRDTDLLQAMQALGSHIGQFIERKRVEDQRDVLFGQLQSAEERYRTLFTGVNDTILVADKEGRYVESNPAASELLGYTREELVHMSVEDLAVAGPTWAADEYNRFLSEGTWTGELELRRKDGSSVAVEARASIIEIPDGQMFVSVLRDISERKRNERELQRLVIQLELSRQRVDNLVSNVPGVVWEAWGQPDEGNQRIDFVSTHVEEMLGYSVNDWLSTPNFWLSIVHPDDRERAAAEAAAIYAGERDGQSEFRWLTKDGREIWVEARSTVIHDKDGQSVGMRGVTMDITERRLADAQVRESEERFSKAFHASPAGVSIVSAAERRFVDVNDSFLQMMGYARDEVVGRLVDEVGIWPDQDQRRQLQEAVAAGQGHVRNVELQIQTRSKEIRSVLGSAEVITLGGQDCVLTLMYDITERKQAETRLKEANALLSQETEALETLNQVGQLLSAELDQRRLVQAVTDGATEQTGAAFGAFFYNVEDAEGQSYQLFTISGADASAFDSFPMPRATEIFAPTFRGEGLVRLDDVTTDPRYGKNPPHLGLPQGHPSVRSYLAVPVVARSGEVLGGLFLGHPEPGVFTERAERIARGLAAQAAIAMDNSRLYEAAQQGRSQAEKSGERQAILAEASAVLASSLDYEDTLSEVSRLLVNRLADICSVDLVEDGSVRRVALSHFDPAIESAFSGMPTVYTPASPEHPVLRVARSGQPEMRGRLQDEELAEAARDQEHLQMLRRLNVHSLLVVPLTAAGRTLGTLTLALSRSENEYKQEDLEFAQELARRAGLAIDNALRYAGEQAARLQAESAVERTARLQAVTAALSESLTAAEVGQVVIDAAMAIARARSGVVVLIGQGGNTLELVASAGVSEAFTETWEDFALNPPQPVLDALKTAQPVFIDSRDDLITMFPGLEKLAVVAGRSFGSSPLKIENTVIGSMVLTFEGPVPAEEDREFILALAGQCAQALERARLYDAEQDARRRAEEANSIVSRLQSLTEAALTHLSLDDLLEELLVRIKEMLNVETTDVLLFNDGRTALVPRAAIGHAPGERSEAQVKLGDGFVGTIAATQRPSIVAGKDDPSGRTLLGVPMIVEGRVTGVLHVGSAAGRVFGEDDARLLQLVADRAALAIDHIELYEAEQRARAEAETAEHRQAFLAKASAILASSLDYETTLASLAELCVPYLGDWCAIDVLTDDKLHRVAVVHADPEKIQYARNLQERYPPDTNDPNMRIMLAEGRSIFYPEVSEELVQATARDPEHLKIIQELGLRSAMAVPLKARGRTLGILTLIMAESGRAYNQADLSLAEDLAHRAALAVDNARLYSESQHIQEELRLANEAKDEFLGLVSHELRTPITTIYGGARLMRSRGDNLDPESKRGVLEDIEHESERLHRIVEDLLVLARVELGQEVITEPVLVQRVAERTVAALSKRKAGRQIDLEMVVDLPPVRASSVYLEQILRNLVNNADKYSPSDQPILVQGRQEGDEIIVSVLDRGPGIPPDELDLIFERFYRSSGTAKQAGGAGIGLTVCKRLLEAQDGRIWAGPRDGGGLVISFSLPAYTEPDDEE